MDPRPVAIVMRSGWLWCFVTDEGTVGDFSSQALAAEHAELLGYRVEFAQ